MKEKLNAAIDALLEQLEEQQKEVVETKKTINALCKRIQKDLMFPDVALETGASGHLRSDQFYGKPLATAAQEFLELRRRACTAEEILHGLEEGGFDFRAMGWKEGDRLRSLAISLAKNNKTFHKLPNNTIGLPSWYPEALKRQEREKEATVNNGKASENAKLAEAPNAVDEPEK